LPLSLDIVEFISQNKVFYDLDKHRDDMLKNASRPRFGLWVLAGSPILLCDLKRERRKEFKYWGYSVGVEDSFVENDFDYIDVRIALDGPNVLPTFAGVSGGGLWQVELQRLPDNIIGFLNEPRLEGCVFTEIHTEDSEYRHLRCHSRKSIYEIGLTKLQAERA
jgi:hypothetical protein